MDTKNKITVRCAVPEASELRAPTISAILGCFGVLLVDARVRSTLYEPDRYKRSPFLAQFFELAALDLPEPPHPPTDIMTHPSVIITDNEPIDDQQALCTSKTMVIDIPAVCSDSAPGAGNNDELLMNSPGTDVGVVVPTLNDEAAVSTPIATAQSGAGTGASDSVVHDSELNVADGGADVGTQDVVFHKVAPEYEHRRVRYLSVGPLYTNIFHRHSYDS